MALTKNKGRQWLVGAPTIDVPQMPVKAAAVIFAGAALSFSAGAVRPLTAGDLFAGFALDSATGGAADGDIQVPVRIQGGVRMSLTTDTPTIAIVGVAATVPEMTDDDTLRVETGAAIAGVLIGKFSKVITPGVAASEVEVLFKGAQVY